MGFPSVTTTIRAPWRAPLAVVLGGLLGACAVAHDEAGSTGGVAGAEESGEMAGGGQVASGEAAASDSWGSDVGGAGGGAGANDAAGLPGTGEVAGPGDTAAAGFGAGGFGAAGSGAGAFGAGDTTGSGGIYEPAAVDVVCNPIVAGMSTVVANGTPRTFSVQLPADTSRMALLFLWHGWMQPPTEFANTIVYDVPSGRWVPFDPNAFPMPLMIVTPHDTKLIPPVGLDWDIVSGDLDFPFFDAMLQCIQEQFDIDETRIYSLGFSAGAVFTNLLSARYPHLFAATISESGAWFNDTAQWSDVLIPLMQWQWPAFDPADGGNVLLTHGGPDDFATVISLESANNKAVPFLRDNGRTVTECAHTFGHTLDPDLTQRMYYDYMWAHQRGGPPLAGLPPGFPTHERPVGATTCTLHPAP